MCFDFYTVVGWRSKPVEVLYLKIFLLFKSDFREAWLPPTEENGFQQLPYLDSVIYANLARQTHFSCSASSVHLKQVSSTVSIISIKKTFPSWVSYKTGALHSAILCSVQYSLSMSTILISRRDMIYDNTKR